MHLLLLPMYKAADRSFQIQMQNVLNKLHMGVAAFEIPFEGRSVFEDWLPHWPVTSRHKHTNIENVQSVSLGFLPLLLCGAHSQAPCPLRDHVSLLDGRRPFWWRGCGRYEGTRQVGGGFTSKGGQFPSLSDSLAHGTLHLSTFSLECLVGMNGRHQSFCCRFSLNSHMRAQQSPVRGALVWTSGGQMKAQFLFLPCCHHSLTLSLYLCVSPSQQERVRVTLSHYRE